jgi:ketopantoate reductase
MADKANVLLVGCGGIGTIASLNLEIGGKASVTAVLRSNYEHVKAHGFYIKSVDHGEVEGFRPSSCKSKIRLIKTLYPG